MNYVFKTTWQIQKWRKLNLEVNNTINKMYNSMDKFDSRLDIAEEAIGKQESKSK